MILRFPRPWPGRRAFLALSAFALFAPSKSALAATVDDLQALTFPDGNGHTLPYRLFVPQGYDAAKKYRLVLFFHGAGERGTDNRNQLAGQTAPLVFADAANQVKWPVFMVAPQCPGDQQWVGMNWGDATGAGKNPQNPTWPMAAALALVDQLMTTYRGIDASRLYVTGLSMGGYGTWDAIFRAPRKFRRAVPICGGYDPNTVTSAAGASGRWFDIPIWDFHSKDDGTVPVGQSIEMLDAIMGKGGMPAPVFTQYGTGNLPAVGHFAWGPAYADKGLLPWMFDNDAELDGGLGGLGDAALPGDAGKPTGDASQNPMTMQDSGGGSAGSSPATGSGGSAGSASMGGSGTVSAGGSGGTSSATPAATDDGGCSCKTAARDRSIGRGAWLIALAVAFVGRRRNRFARS